MSNSFIYKIFQKEPVNLSLDDLREYFSTPQEETAILEFKSGQVEIEEIYREVAAFHNTEGDFGFSERN